MLAEYRLAEHLADDDGCKAYDDRAAPHVDIGEALVLAHKSAGERHDAVGYRKAEDLHRAYVDAEGAAHCGV